MDIFHFHRLYQPVMTAEGNRMDFTVDPMLKSHIRCLLLGHIASAECVL